MNHPMIRTGRTYSLMGFEVPQVKPAAYWLLVKFVGGREHVQGASDNPTTARAFESQVTRNRKVIDRIELHDTDGCLDTIWSRDWEEV